MKYILIVATLLLIGCTNSQTTKTNTNEYGQIDSLIGKSQQNLTIASGANQKSDSLVTGKIEKTAKKITKLENEVKQLKAENNELKEKLDDANDDGSNYRIRAISDN
jgi:peptidoglycan hydrolase CwlO-like protein